MINIFQALTEEHVQLARSLFIEYADSLNIDLCFQNFDLELAGLPGEYSPPSGRLLLAKHEDKIAGCVALRKIDDEVCEMKRLYVKPAFRGLKLGRRLADEIIEEAKAIGYKKMRLDTLPQMREAINMYKSIGFYDIEPYRYNPEQGALFMEKEL
jgi:ribosomal protein S18 acetylase RimI-like enzyme